MGTSLTEAIEEEDFIEAIRLLDAGADPNQLVFDKPIIIKVAECHENFEHGDEGYTEMVNLVLKLAESGANLQSEDPLRNGLLNKLFSGCVPLDVIGRLTTSGLKPVNSEDDVVKGALGGISDALMNYQDIDYVIAALDMVVQESAGKLTQDVLGRMLVDYFIHAQDDYSNFEYEHLDLYPKFLDKIVEIGGDINATSVSGHTALMRAAMNTFPNIVGYLIEKGVELNAQSENGNTALMFASGRLPEASDRGMGWEETSGRIEICQKLVEAGANQSLRNKQGKTVVDLATEFESTEILKLFR